MFFCQEEDVLFEHINIRTHSLTSADKCLDQGESKDDATVSFEDYFPRWTNGFSRLELQSEQVSMLSGAVSFVDVLFSAVYEKFDAHLAKSTLDIVFFNKVLLNLQQLQDLIADPECAFKRAATIVRNVVLLFFTKVLAVSMLGDNPVALEFTQSLNNEEFLLRINKYFDRYPLLQIAFLCNLRRQVGEVSMHSLLQRQDLTVPFQQWLMPWKSSLSPNASARLIAKHMFPFQFISSVPGV
jgi:hypothetical protein